MPFLIHCIQPTGLKRGNMSLNSMFGYFAFTDLHYSTVVRRHSPISMFSFLSESEESDYDDQCLGGTGKFYLLLLCEFWAFRSVVVEDSILTGYDDAIMGGRIPTFRDDVTVSSSTVSNSLKSLKMRTLRCFITSDFDWHIDTAANPVETAASIP
jgi:hypothetical protein